VLLKFITWDICGDVIEVQSQSGMSDYSRFCSGRFDFLRYLGKLMRN